MMKNIIPHSGIYTDARWCYSKTKGWIFGYKLHMTSSSDSLIVPSSAELTTINIRDNNIYQSITISLPEGIRYVAADEGYDNHGLRAYPKINIIA